MHNVCVCVRVNIYIYIIIYLHFFTDACGVSGFKVQRPAIWVQHLELCFLFLLMRNLEGVWLGCGIFQVRSTTTVVLILQGLMVRVGHGKSCKLSVP